MSSSMTFVFTADIEFDAEDLDDAFEKLRNHFQSLVDGIDTELGQIGNMELKPKERKEP